MIFESVLNEISYSYTNVLWYVLYLIICISAEWYSIVRSFRQSEKKTFITIESLHIGCCLFGSFINNNSSCSILTHVRFVSSIIEKSYNNKKTEYLF